MAGLLLAAVRVPAHRQGDAEARETGSSMWRWFLQMCIHLDADVIRRISNAEKVL